MLLKIISITVQVNFLLLIILWKSIIKVYSMEKGSKGHPRNIIWTFQFCLKLTAGAKVEQSYRVADLLFFHLLLFPVVWH